MVRCTDLKVSFGNAAFILAEGEDVGGPDLLEPLHRGSCRGLSLLNLLQHGKTLGAGHGEGREADK